MHKALAIAALCCCPPDNCPGYLRACSEILTFFKYSIAISSLLFFGIFLTHAGANAQLSKIVRWGNKLNCWKTIPTSLLILSIFFNVLSNSIPSTIMFPSWCCSSPFMHLIRVDFPEPDGPQIIIFSPLFTNKLISLSTWNLPYHLFTFLNSIIFSLINVFLY